MSNFYNLNETQIYLNDCKKTIEEMIVQGVKVDLIITDPPYDIKNTKTGGKSKLNKSFQKSQTEIQEKKLTNGFDTSILRELVKLQDNINIYFFCNKAQIPMYLEFFVNELNCSFDIIKWVKTNPVPTFSNKYMSDTEYCMYFRKKAYCKPQSYKDASTLFHSPINTKDKKKYKHPTIKPLELIDRLVRNSSKENDLIFDPFMGSGTTGMSALKHNRKFIGVELDKEYFEISKNRLNLEAKNNELTAYKQEVA